MPFGPRGYSGIDASHICIYQAFHIDLMSPRVDLYMYILCMPRTHGSKLLFLYLEQSIAALKGALSQQVGALGALAVDGG